MTDKTIKPTLEEIFKEEGNKLFPEQDQKRLSSDISDAINRVSSIVLSALNAWWTAEQINAQIEDSRDFIKSELKNNPKFDELLKNFINKKVVEIETSGKGEESKKLVEDKIETKEETLDQLVTNLKKHTIYIQSSHGTFEHYKKEIKWLSNIINEETLSFIERTLNDIKEEYESEIIVIRNSIEEIKKILNIITTQKDELSVSPELKNNIYDENWDILSILEINNIKIIISEINTSILDIEEKINDEKEKLLTKSILEVQEKKADTIESIDIDIINDPIIKWYIEELLIREEINNELTISSIKELYRWINDTTQDTTINKQKKLEILKTPFRHIDLSFINGDKEALDLFKTITLLMIKKSLKEFEEGFNLVFSIPEKYQKEVMVLLKTIVKLYSEDKKEEEISMIKKKCESFIEELDKVTPEMLSSITENQDIDEFFVEIIIPILQNLDIPIKFHKNFKQIVDIFYKDQKEIMFKQVLKGIRENNKLDMALLDLIKTISVYPENIRKTCENCLNYLIHNLILKIPRNIIIELETWKKESKGTSDAKTIAMKMHNYSLTSSRTEPLDKVLIEAKTIIDKRKTKIHGLPKRISSLPLSKELFNEVTDEIFSHYINIPDTIKVKIKKIAELYYFWNRWSIMNFKEKVKRAFQ